MVVHFITVVELLGIEFAHSRDRVRAVHAFNRPEFVFIGIAPWNSFVPVEMRSNRVALTILFYLELLVSAESRVGKAFADNGVANPKYELLVLAVGYLCFIHPETIDRDTSGIGLEIPQRIIFGNAYFHGASVDKYHSVWCGFDP